MSAAEVVTALTKNVSPIPWFRKSETPFIGSVSTDGFRIIRVVRGRDSFNPMLYGRIRQDPTGTTLQVTATLHPFVWTFMTMWSAVLGISMWRDSNSPDLSWILASVLFVLAPWLMAAVFFPPGAAKSRALLETCLRPVASSDDNSAPPRSPR